MEKSIKSKGAMTHLVYGVSMPISEQYELKIALKAMLFDFSEDLSNNLS